MQNTPGRLYHASDINLHKVDRGEGEGLDH